MAKKLVRKPVLFLVGTGDESLLKRRAWPYDSREESHRFNSMQARDHRQTAIRLMLEAQRKGFPIVMTDRKSDFLTMAKRKGVRTREILFTRHFRAVGMLDKLKEKGVEPSVVIMGGHYRHGCMNAAIKVINYEGEFRNGRSIKGARVPDVKVIIGTASVPGFLGGVSQLLRDRPHTTPITIQQFNAMGRTGRIPARFGNVTASVEKYLMGDTRKNKTRQKIMRKRLRAF